MCHILGLWCLAPSTRVVSCEVHARRLYLAIVIKIFEHFAFQPSPSSQLSRSPLAEAPCLLRVSVSMKHYTSYTLAIRPTRLADFEILHIDPTRT